MKFEFTSEQLMLRDMVRDFAVNEVAPTVDEREEKGEFPREILKKAAELGLCTIAVKEDDGGSGFDKISEVLAIIELAQICPSTALSIAVTNAVFCWPVENYGSAEQKEKYLGLVAAGEMLGAFCLSEPDAGSDAGNLQVKATEDGDDFVIEGTKAWITHGGLAGAYIVMAVTGEKDGRKEITAFIVDEDMPGVSVGRIESKMGLRSSRTTQMVFDNVRVPKSSMLGERGQGLKIALATLDQSRIGIAAQAIGIGRGALKEAIKYSQERVTFGKPLARHQAISFMLADMATELEAAELMTFRAAWMLDQGMKFSKESSMAKLYATEICKRVVDQAVQIHGSYGYSKEYPVERFYRDARITTIYEGTSEVQKMVIARNLILENR